MKKAVCIALLCLYLLTGCMQPAAVPTELQATAAPEPSGAAEGVSGEVEVQRRLGEIHALGVSPDDNYRTWYEVFVYSFCDSDGDGIGDLRGLASKLDYLQELGVTGIWLMPIHPSPSYHKYDVSDYYAIDSAYGTMEDFDLLMAECQKRDIHVILDLVLNHSGSGHPWFTQAVEYLRDLGDKEPNGKDCPYFNYYHFTRENLPGFTLVDGTDWHYESQFSPDMPDLNLACEDLRKEIRDIMAFWLEKGVSGFRLDAAKEYYTGSASKNLEVLNWVQETGESLKEDIYLVAEVWDGFAAVSEYYESGLTSFFDFPFADAGGKIITVIRGAGNPAVVSTYATALEKADAAYSAANPDYIDAPFLSNHDTGRIASYCSGDEARTKLAGAMNLFMSGSAFVYYGEELGMTGSGNDPSKRAPMYWNEERNQGMTNPPPQCVLPESYPFPSYEVQKEEGNSIYNYYRQAIAIRQAIPAISHGKTTAEMDLNLNCVSAYRKTWGEETAIVLMNISPETAQADLNGYETWILAATLSATDQEIVLEGNTLYLPPWGTAVLIPGK